MIELAYRSLAWGLTPVLGLVLLWRARTGKEDPARLGERWGHASTPRPTGRLVWLHAASVGEALSLLPVLTRLLDLNADLTALVTTGTVTSATMMAARLPAARATHQFLPIDHPLAVRRFLDHWRPDLAIWVESELWPVLIEATRRRGLSMALINARLSTRSFRNWRRLAGPARRILGGFSTILAQDALQAERFASLAGRPVETLGDLKSAAQAATPDEAALERLRTALQGRPVWLAASTHPGEETIVAAVHRAVRARLPGLVTVLAPRHTARAASILAELGDLRVARRSGSAVPDRQAELWLIDTMGELDLFYALVPLVLIGGSLGTPGTVGGHNPMEAAAAARAILHGPDMANAAASTERLDQAGAALAVRDAADLARLVGDLLADPDRLCRMGEAARRVAADRGVLDRVVARLLPLLPAGSGHAGT